MDEDRSVMTSPVKHSRIPSGSSAASAVQTASQGRVLLVTAIMFIIATWTIGFAAYWWYAAEQREDAFLFYLGFCGLVSFIICATIGGARILLIRKARTTLTLLSADPRLPKASDFPPGTAFVINEFDVPLVSIPDSDNKTVTWFNWYGGVPRVYDPSYLQQGNSWDADSFEEWVGIVKESLDPGSAVAPQLTTVPVIETRKNELPCCGGEARYVTELSHVYQFDLDLHQCENCGRYWVRAWRMGIGGWEKVTPEDAEKMQALRDEELRDFMRGWAQYLG